MTLVAPSSTATAPVTTEKAFSFTGSGSEYFRIWIVNIALTLATLGVYSAWAKVRRLQYFHRSTRIADASFDYHGRPLPILFGRLVIVAFVLLLNVSQSYSQHAYYSLLIVLAVTMPWLIWRSLRFRLYNTSYRGIRFRFTGSRWGSYRAFLLWPLAATCSVGLLAPLANRSVQRYRQGHAALGRTSFSFHGKASAFYGVGFAWLGAALALTALIYAALWLVRFEVTDFLIDVLESILASQGKTIVVDLALKGMIAIAVMSATFYLSILVTMPLFKGLMLKLVWSRTQIGPHGIACRLSIRRYLGLRYANALLTIVTLGLYRPFAQVRLTRYVLSCLALVPAAPLGEFVRGETDEAGTMGDAFTDVFDIAF